MSTSAPPLGVLRAGVAPARPRRPRRCHRDRALRRRAGAAHQGRQAAGIAARLPPPSPIPWHRLGPALVLPQGGSGRLDATPKGERAPLPWVLERAASEAADPPPMDRCLLVHPGFGADPLTARAALLHRRRAAQGTRQAAAAARVAAAARAFVGGPAGAPRQCAALTAHAALMTTVKYMSRVLGSRASPVLCGRARFSYFIVQSLVYHKSLLYKVTRTPYMCKAYGPPVYGFKRG